MDANVAYSYVHTSWWSKLRRSRRGGADHPRYHTQPEHSALSHDADLSTHSGGNVMKRATYAYRRAPFTTEPDQGLSVGMYALLGKLQPFFEREENADILLRLLHKKASARHTTSVHMRNFAWFCMHYAQDQTVKALVTVHGRAMYPPSVLAALHRSFTRESMDAHCREDRRTGRCGAVLFHWRGVVVRTTVAQLNYVHWMVVSGVYASLLRCSQEVAAHAKEAPRANKTHTTSALGDAVLFVESGAGSVLRLRGHERAEWCAAEPTANHTASSVWAPIARPARVPCNKVS